MSYIFSFLGKYIIYALCSLLIYIPVRLIYIKCKKVEKDIFREILLGLFFFCLVGLISQTLFPLIRFDIEDIKLHIFFYSRNSLELSREGIFYRNENEIIRNVNLIPFNTIIQYLTGKSDLYQGRDIILNSIVNMVGNIVLFIPIGFLFTFVSDRFKKLRTVLISGVLIILAIEILQYIIGRSADIDDLIVNTLGLLCGYLITKIPLINKMIFWLQEHLNKNETAVIKKE